MDAHDAAIPGFAFSDDLLVFDNLHVDIGPELPDEITEIHWWFADGVEVSVLVPIEPPPVVLADLPAFHDNSTAGMDWLL